MLFSSGVFEIEPDDLARVVDAGCNRAEGARRGIVEDRRVCAAIKVVEEAVRRPADIVRSNDLSRTADARSNRSVGGQGMIEGGEGPAT